jgi:hypothetical protein
MYVYCIFNYYPLFSSAYQDSEINIQWSIIPGLTTLDENKDEKLFNGQENPENPVCFSEKPLPRLYTEPTGGLLTLCIFNYYPLFSSAYQDSEINIQWSIIPGLTTLDENKVTCSVFTTHFDREVHISFLNDQIYFY